MRPQRRSWYRLSVAQSMAIAAALSIAVACAPRAAAPPFPVVDQRISGGPPVGSEVALRLDQGPVERPSPVILAQGIDPAQLDRLADDPEACRGALVVQDAEGPDDAPAVPGRYEVDRESATLRFIPSLPLDGGARYRATWDPGGSPTVSAEFVTAPRPSGKGKAASAVRP